MRQFGWNGSPLGAPTAFLPEVKLSGPPQISLGRPFLGQAVMGQDMQTAQAWYERAKKSIDRYKFLKSRVEAIANKTERENVKTWMGAPGVAGTPEYRFASVVSDFTQDVAKEGVGAYNIERRQNRVADLEDVNDAFDQKIKFAIQTYGELPASAIPGYQPPGGAAPSKGPDLTIPIVGVGAAIVLALLLS